MSGKKRKVNQNCHENLCADKYAAYVEGSILRIKLENFVTYDSVEIIPGPRLNVLIGPNATGKSTVVCAICLGLAGKPSILGRASSAAEFIRHGCQQATIEIELCNKDGDNYIIRREIFKNTSNWWVNDRQAPQKAVEELTSRLKIQISNLCQFLPQDKVADFAKMSQQELLENTEKAVGATDLYESHCKLKTSGGSVKTMELAFERSKTTLESKKAQNARLEQDIKNYNERMKHLERVKVLKEKRPWVEYETKRKLYNSLKEKKEQMATEVRAERAKLLPLQKKLETANNAQKSLEAQMKSKAEQIKEYAKQANDASKAVDIQNDKLEEAQDQLRAKKLDEGERSKKLCEMRDQLQSLQYDLAELGDNENVQPAIDKVNQGMREVNRDITRHQQQSSMIRQEGQNLQREITGLESEVKKIQNVANQRLEMLKQKHKDVYAAVMWLRNNSDKFRGKIYEPIMTLINMKDQKMAKYVETQISSNDMRAFVCENPDDMNTFLKLVRDEQNLAVFAVKAPQEPLSHFKPPKPIDAYRQCDFYCYVKDVFDCPDPVMRYLCLMYRVHAVPIGTDRTKNNVDNVKQQFPELTSFYTENHQYSIRKSRYGAQMTSTRCTELRPAQLLTKGANHARELELKQQIQEKQATKQGKDTESRELQKKCKELEVKMNLLRNQKKELTDKRDLRRNLDQKIKMKQQSISRIDSEKIDMAAEELKFQWEVTRINCQKCDLLKKMKDSTKNCMITSMDKVRLTIRHASAIQEVNGCEKQLQEHGASLRAVEQEFERLKENCKEARDEARRVLEKATQTTNTKLNEDIPTELRKAFDTCPNTLEDIDNAIHDEQARADCTLPTDETVVKDYHLREKEIARLEVELQKHILQLQNHKSNVDGMKTTWLKPLSELINQINKNFTYFFRCMKCAGEVDLNVPPNADDFDKYGIRIKVKFRDTEPLRELTPFHQSGGEKSVATMLYMMALQSITRCPFRCVDEINQGMDPQNERKVFELVTRTISQENTSQYFLLSPKLLPDLDYSDDMTVLFVHNGPFMLNHKEWNLRKFIRRRERLED